MKIGIIGQDFSEYDYESKYSFVEKLLSKAVYLDMICLPEMFLISEYNSITEEVLNYLNNLRLRIRKKTIDSGIAISYGTIVGENNKSYIAQIIVLPDGSEYEYRKMILGKNEAKVFDKGNELCTFKYKGFKFGVLLCIETHLPELSYLYKREGCQILLSPFKMPGKIGRRLDIWKKYIPGRSYDYNMVHICNNYYGGIMAVDGKGNELEVTSISGITYVEISNEDSFNERVNFFDYSREELILNHMIKDRTGD